ncbi:hypothetical protein GOP47_0028807 [Adiantum capillus-veneris]|nr:hypothetical protein GOP47_0028807 [Adiantum capillus-veneris]
MQRRARQGRVGSIFEHARPEKAGGFEGREGDEQGEQAEEVGCHRWGGRGWREREREGEAGRLEWESIQKRRATGWCRLLGGRVADYRQKRTAGQRHQRGELEHGAWAEGPERGQMG